MASIFVLLAASTATWHWSLLLWFLIIDGSEELPLPNASKDLTKPSLYYQWFFTAE
jgi:hypothetical protein